MNKADILKKLLSFGSQTAPELIDDAAPLARRASSELIEEAPEVIGKGTSKATKKAGDILDAELVAPKISTLDSLKDFAKKNPGKIVGGLSLAEMARQMMSGGEEPPVPPMAPKGQEPILPELIQPEAKGIAPAPKVGHPNDAMNAQVLAGLQGLPKGGDLVAPAAAPAEEMDFLKMMEAAQQKSNRDRNDASMVRASELFAGGMARIKPEHGSSDIMRADADKEIEHAKGKITASKEQQAFNKAKDELNDETKMRDPNSDISKSTVAQLARFGIKVKTAQEAKQMNPQIFNLLSQERAQANARDIANIGVTAAKTKAGTVLDEKQRKFAQGLRKEATTGVLGKQYATYATGQRMTSSLSEFAKNPSGYKDYATLMGGLKSLQGDESVVRETEVRLGQDATSAINKAYNYVQRLSTGQSLTDSQRREMLDTIQILTNASKVQYMHSVAPILEQAQMEGIDPGLILSGSLNEANKEKKEQITTSSNTRTFKSKQAPGSTVTVKSGTKYKIGPDGMTGTEIP